MKHEIILSQTTNNNEYNRIKNFVEPYWEDCWQKHKRKRKFTIYKFKYREYRTWKHNRKTKWKQQ
ncbi:MAG: hypothetical protein ABIP51_15985, partial [Bacteroidia bacterium]